MLDVRIIEFQFELNLSRASPPLLFVVIIKSHWFGRVTLSHTQMSRSFLSLQRRSMHSILDFFALFCSLLFLTEISPRCNSLFTVLLPCLHVLLYDLICCCFFLSLMLLFPLSCSFETFEEILTLLDLLKKLVAHVLHLKVECLLW